MAQGPPEPEHPLGSSAGQWSGWEGCSRHTSLSILAGSKPQQWAQCRDAAFLKRVKICAWFFGTHLPHPSLPHVFHLLLLQHYGSWSPGQLPAQVITRCLAVFEQDICSPWFPVLHACAGLQAACHPEKVHFPGKGTPPSVASSSTKWAFCKHGIMEIPPQGIQVSSRFPELDTVTRTGVELWHFPHFHFRKTTFSLDLKIPRHPAPSLWLTPCHLFLFGINFPFCLHQSFTDTISSRYS